MFEPNHSPAVSNSPGIHDTSLERSAPWSPGATIARCHGVMHNGDYLIASNFVVGQSEPGKAPCAVVPFAIEDTYLSRLSEAVLGPKEHALTIPTVPGHEKYLREMGMLHSESRLIELPYNPPNKDSVGYPDAEIFALAGKHGLAEFKDSCTIAWFPSPAVKAAIAALGSQTPQESNAYFTNNKVYIREKAPEYGITMCDGLVLQGAEDIEKAAQMFADAKCVWIKNDIGSGGDGVIRLEAPVTAERIRECVAKQYALAAEAFKANKFADYSLEQYWGSTDPTLPPGKPPRIVIEADVTRHGTPIANCSNFILVKSDGTYSVERYFRQRVTPEGAYQGSQPYVELTESTRAELDVAMKSLARFCYEHRLFGIVGVDFILVERADGTLEPRIIELNGRPPVSASAVMAAEKLHAPAWINCNIWAPSDLNTMAEFEELMTLGDINHARTSRQEGLVFPLAFRALYSLDENGEKKLFHQSKSARILICGDSMEQCEALLHRLVTERGIKLQPPQG